MIKSIEIPEILCLRPEKDFLDVGVIPPKNLKIHYKNIAEDKEEITHLKTLCKALVIPAVGEKIETSFFTGTNIKMVQVTGAGFDRLDVSKLKEKNIIVCNVPGGSNEAVAEYCHTGAILMLRQLFNLHTANPDQYSQIRSKMIKTKMHSLTNLSVGIIGYGNIGKATASLFRKSGCKIQVFDPMINENNITNELNTTKSDLDKLLKTSDILSIHIPLSKNTRHLINSAELSLMKPTSILINAARGGIVNETALAKAITTSQIGGAVVDVFSTEPPSSDNPLFKIPKPQINRLLLTPHIAGITSQSWNKLFSKSWKNVLDCIFNKSPSFIVN